MAPFVKGCPVCLCNYDNESKKPLMLPCGHSFCRECLRCLYEASNRVCSVCRSNWDGETVSSLPICFQLLPEQSSGDDPLWCEDHGSSKEVWCQTCEERCCLECLHYNHKDCDWLPVSVYIGDLHEQIRLEWVKVETKVSENVDVVDKWKREIQADLSVALDLQRELSLAIGVLRSDKQKLDDCLIVRPQGTGTLSSSSANRNTEIDILTILEEQLSSLKAYEGKTPSFIRQQDPIGRHVIQWFKSHRQNFRQLN